MTKRFNRLYGVTQACARGFAAFILSISLGASAHAMGNLSIVGAVKSTSHFAGGVTSPNDLGYGGGLLLAFHLLPRLSLESGAVYFVTTPSSLYVPIDLRLHFSRRFSVSGGAYFDHYSQSGFRADHGYEIGGRISFFKWFLDGRYLGGLEKLGGVAYSGVIGMLGMHFGL